MTKTQTTHTADILAAAQSRRDAETKSAAAYRKANTQLTAAAAAALRDGVEGWRIQQLLEERGLR